MTQKQRHNYEYDVDISGPTAPARVVRMVGGNKRVLEVGAGPGSITKMLKGVGNCRVTGLEIDDSAIVKLKEFCEKVYKADLNDPTWPDMLAGEEPFDTIVAADVLEHVYNPLEVLRAIAGIAGSHGEVVISLPHVGHNAIIACLLDEDFQYRDWGLLDRTHIRFFGLKNMQQLFKDAGLKIVEAQFVITPPEDSEFADKWRRLDQKTKSVLAKNKLGEVYQVVIRAVSAGRTDEAVDLMSIPVEKSGSVVDAEHGMRRLARRFLSDRSRKKIRVMMNSSFKLLRK